MLGKQQKARQDVTGGWGLGLGSGLVLGFDLTSQVMKEAWVWMLCMSSAVIPVNVFMEEPPTSRSATANGTIHLTHSSSSTLFKAAATQELTRPAKAG